MLVEVAEQQSLPEYAVSLIEEKQPSPRGGRPRIRTLVGFRVRPAPLLAAPAIDG